MIDKILKIQNKSKSLMWGCADDGDEAMFAVGHKSYPRQTRYFIVSKDFVVSIPDENHKKVFVKKCENEEEVIKEVTLLLKEWFPAKGGAS